MPRPRPGAIALTAVCCLAATLAHAAGLSVLEVPADAGAPALTGMVWTPCTAPAAEVELRGVVLPGVKDCPIAGNRLPLIVMSHGRRGSFLGHVDTAASLADAGFVVAAINHPGDTARDSSRTDEFAVLVERPADMKRLADFMLGAWTQAAVLDPRRVGLFGFSRGAYTGLVVIGGNPDFGALAPLCASTGATTPKCRAIREGRVPTAAPVHDPRVGAAILADPPLFEGLFDRDRLAGVTIPILLWRSALGGDGVAPEAVDALVPLLPMRPDYRIVPNSAHFSFIGPCPPKLAEAAPILCTDPPGFDRKAFHDQFNDEAVAFFRTHLGATKND
jgi:predicted dienelactone hydrolase